MKFLQGLPWHVQPPQQQLRGFLSPEQQIPPRLMMTPQLAHLGRPVPGVMGLVIGTFFLHFFYVAWEEWQCESYLLKEPATHRSNKKGLRKKPYEKISKSVTKMSGHPVLENSSCRLGKNRCSSMDAEFISKRNEQTELLDNSCFRNFDTTYAWEGGRNVFPGQR